MATDAHVINTLIGCSYISLSHNSDIAQIPSQHTSFSRFIICANCHFWSVLTVDVMALIIGINKLVNYVLPIMNDGQHLLDMLLRDVWELQINSFQNTLWQQA